MVLARAFGIICFATLYWRRPNTKALTGTLLAALWAFPMLLLLQVFAVKFRWWYFDATEGLLRDIPVDLLFGWVILWAMTPTLFPHSWHSGLILTGLFLLDLLLMPYLSPILQLGNGWVVGELFGILIVSLPALWIARWTAAGINLKGRITLQIVTFGALLFWFLPEIGTAWGVVDWRVIGNRPVWQIGLAAQLLALPALIGLTAVQEFTVRGEGTPLPLDPPSKLVTSGIYAYIANPMQFAGTILLIGFGLLLGSFWFIAGATMACLYSIGIADWSEQGDLHERHGERWQQYRLLVHKWRFCWKPWGGQSSSSIQQKLVTGPLYIPNAGGFFTKVRIWFGHRSPIALTLADAKQHSSPVRSQITYESGDGRFMVTGVAAIARGLEHINLAWAMVGFALRLSGINKIVQCIVDSYDRASHSVDQTLSV